MEKVTVAQAVEQLKLELVACGVSLREVEKRVGRSIRHKLAEGKQDLLTFQDLLDILDAAGIESKPFFARLLGLDGPLPFALLKPRESPIWSKSRQRVLAALETMTAAGSRGFETVQERLAELETQFENQPGKAEAAAWKLLASCREPGAVVDVLLVLATFSNPSRSFHLLSLAIEILGPLTECAVGGRLSSAIGRYYLKAGFNEDALVILQSQALPRVLLFGNAAEQGQVYYRIARVAGTLGRNSLRIAALRNAASVGGDRIRFAAMQLLAFQQLNDGHAAEAADLYDEIVKLPYFQAVGRRARATVAWSRISAHFVAGHLGPGDEPDFRAIVEETRAVLDPGEQIGATLDLALFLQSIGKSTTGRQFLEAEFLRVLEVEDLDLQHRYAMVWKALGLPADARIWTLVNRQASKPLQTHPRG